MTLPTWLLAGLFLSYICVSHTQTLVTLSTWLLTGLLPSHTCRFNEYALVTSPTWLLTGPGLPHSCLNNKQTTLASPLSSLLSILSDMQFPPLPGFLALSYHALLIRAMIEAILVIDKPSTYLMLFCSSHEAALLGS